MILSDLLKTWTYFTLTFDFLFGQTSIQEALCRHLFIKILKNDLSQQVLEDVYTMENNLYNGFPVYKSDTNGFFLYYSRLDNEDYLWLGEGMNTYVMYGTTNFRPSRWTDWMSTESDPFARLIRMWYHYDPHINETIPLGLQGIVMETHCVQSSRYICSSRQLYFIKPIIQETLDEGFTVISSPNDVFFSQLEGITRESRPVYRMIGGTSSAFLYFSEEYWVVGRDYLDEDVFMRCRDSAFRVEYIICMWELYSAGHYRPQRDLQLDCRGSRSDNDTTKICDVTGSSVDSPCLQYADCRVNSLEEIVCECPRGYHGKTCEYQTRKCPEFTELLPHSLGPTIQVNDVNDVTSHVCTPGTTPSYVLSICTNGNGSARWDFNGRCTPPPGHTTYQMTSSGISIQPLSRAYMIFWMICLLSI